MFFGFFSKFFFQFKAWAHLKKLAVFDFLYSFFWNYEYSDSFLEQTSLLSDENQTMRLRPLWGFQGSSLLYLPSPEQGNVLYLHPWSSSKGSVTAEDSEEPILAPRAKREECFPASGGVFRVLCLFLGVFEGKIADVCFFLIFVHIFAVSQNWIFFSHVFSEPYVCCKTTETSVLSKVTSMRLPENTYFFPREKIAILTFYLYFTKCETAWHGGWPFNRARNCRNSKKCFWDYDKFCESCAFWTGVFVEFVMKIFFFLLYHLCNFIFFEVIFFIEPFFVRESFRKQLRWAWVVQNTIVGCFSFLHRRKK